MKKITRDIRLTLMIKFVLLLILWIVCFKGAEKNTTSLPQWLYGASAEGSEIIATAKHVTSSRKQ